MENLYTNFVHKTKGHRFKPEIIYLKYNKYITNLIWYLIYKIFKLKNVIPSLINCQLYSLKMFSLTNLKHASQDCCNYNKTIHPFNKMNCKLWKMIMKICGWKNATLSLIPCTQLTNSTDDW